MRLIALPICLALAGCESLAPSIPPADVTPPAGVLLAPPPRLPDIPKGAGLAEVVKDDIQCRRAYGRETDKLRLLQGYQSTIRTQARQ